MWLLPRGESTTGARYHPAARSIVCLAAWTFVCSHIVGCQTCTDVGCGTTQTFTIHATSGALPPGEYEINVSDWQSSASASCDVQAPPAPSGCSGGSGVVSAYLVENTEGTVAIVVTTPGSVSFGVSRDGAPLQVIRVSSVREHYPNGPDCGPACKSLTEDVTLQ